MISFILFVFENSLLSIVFVIVFYLFCSFSFNLFYWFNDFYFLRALVPNCFTLCICAVLLGGGQSSVKDFELHLQVNLFDWSTDKGASELKVPFRSTRHFGVFCISINKSKEIKKNTYRVYLGCCSHRCCSKEQMKPTSKHHNSLKMSDRRDRTADMTGRCPFSTPAFLRNLITISLMLETYQD